MKKFKLFSEFRGSVIYGDTLADAVKHAEIKTPGNYNRETQTTIGAKNIRIAKVLGYTVIIQTDDGKRLNVDAVCIGQITPISICCRRQQGGEAMNFCQACGKPIKGGISIGGTLLDPGCAEDVRAEIDLLRAAGKPVNAMQIARRLFRETHSAGNYLLRDVPDELWNRAKHRAVDDGDSLRDLILKAIIAYLK